VAIGMVEPTVYALVGDGLHRPPEFVGVLVSVQGGGAILGGILVSAAIRRVGEPSLIVVGLTVIAAGAGLSAVPALPAALVGFGFVGIGIPVLGVAIATLLQRCTPNAVMGRVAAGYDMIGTVPTTASIALGAVLVGVWPYQVILGITAVGCVLAALSMLPARRALRAAAPVAPAAATGESPVVPAP
jgi:MFS family permease